MRHHTCEPDCLLIQITGKECDKGHCEKTVMIEDIFRPRPLLERFKQEYPSSREGTDNVQQSTTKERNTQHE